MQPGPPPEYSPSGPPPAQPAAGWPPPGHQPPASASTSRPAEPVVAARRTRPGLVVLAAVLTEAVLIAGADNQWVVDRLTKSAAQHSGSLGSDLSYAVLNFGWRAQPLPIDVINFLHAQWAMLALIVALTAFLVWLAARGAGFASVFFGTWTAVAAATSVGAIVRNALIDSSVMQGQSRFHFALFGQIVVSSKYVLISGLGLGFIVGLVAGIVAALVSRREVVPAAVGDRPVVRDDAPTTQLERPPADAGPTQQFAPVQEDPIEQFRGARDTRAEPEPTQELPRAEQ